jgi:predicted nucleotidyltransferase
MTGNPIAERLGLAQDIANRFPKLPDVEAIALGGSTASGYAGPTSDIDLYVYVTQLMDLCLTIGRHQSQPDKNIGHAQQTN